MIKDAIRVYNEGVSALREHIDHTSYVRKIIRFSNRKHLKKIAQHLPEERIFDYKLKIISLYGLYEHCIESLIREYILTLSKYSMTFDDFPDQIKKNYILRWKSVHKYSEEGHSKFSHLTEERLVENLYKTIYEKNSSILPECFISTGGNYKHKIICENMKSVGLGDSFSQLKMYPPLSSYLIKEQKEDIDSPSIFSSIDELVDRRNEIAHGGIPDEIISEEMFDRMLSFVSSYVNAIGAFLQDKINEKEWQLETRSSFKSANIYDKISVVSFKIIDVQINKNDYCLVYSKTQIPHYYKKKILGLYIETEDKKGRPVEFVDARGIAQTISIKIDNPIQGKYKFVS